MAATRIGVTGTQIGTTPDQRASLAELIVGLQPSELHHADGLGADADIHGIIREHLPRTRVVLHPPENPVARAFCRGDEERRTQPYPLCDRDITVETDRIIAALSGPERPLGRGWRCVRYAASLGRRVTIVWPDGSIEERSSREEGSR